MACWDLEQSLQSLTGTPVTQFIIHKIKCYVRSKNALVFSP